MNEPREERYSTEILTRDRGGYTDQQHYLGAGTATTATAGPPKTRDGHQLGRFGGRGEAITELLYPPRALRRPARTQPPKAPAGIWSPTSTPIRSTAPPGWTSTPRGPPMPMPGPTS